MWWNKEKTKTKDEQSKSIEHLQNEINEQREISEEKMKIIDDLKENTCMDCLDARQSFYCLHAVDIRKFFNFHKSYMDPYKFHEYFLPVVSQSIENSYLVKCSKHGKLLSDNEKS